MRLVFYDTGRDQSKVYTLLGYTPILAPSFFAFAESALVATADFKANPAFSALASGGAQAKVLRQMRRILNSPAAT